MEAELEDLYRELWLRQRDSGNIVWITKDGRHIPIKDMGLNHLINTIKMLERNEEMREICIDSQDILGL